MGCWNQTCSLTNLPILYNDKIVVLPLIIHNTSLLDGISYDINDKCSPICVPIIGTYNEYGGIENIENRDIVLNCLKSFSFIDNSGNDIIDYSNVEDFLKFVFEDNIFFNRNDCLYKVTYMMFHYDLYQKLLNEICHRKPYNEDLTYRELLSNKITCYVNERVHNAKKKTTTKAKTNCSIVFETMKKSMKDMCPDVNDDTIDELVGDVLTHSFSLKLGSRAKNTLIFEYLINSLIKLFDNNILSILLDMITFEKVLSFSRKGYLVSTGLGHQGKEMKLHLIISDFVKNYVGKYIDKMKENESLDENDIKELMEEDFFWN